MSDSVKITGDATQYTATMERAGQAADRFAGRVSKAGGGIEALFKRSPHMRAERALSGFLTQAASGDIVGGLTSITGRMTGLGLAAGVAVGVGVEMFEKLHGAIKETEAAEAALNQVLLSPAKLVGAAQGVAGLTKHLEETHAATEKLRASSDTWLSHVAEGIRSSFGEVSAIGFGGGASGGKKSLDAQKAGRSEEDATGKEMVRLDRMGLLESQAHDRRQSTLLGADPDDKIVQNKMAAIEKITAAEDAFSKKKAQFQLEDVTNATNFSKDRIEIAAQELSDKLGMIDAEHKEADKHGTGEFKHKEAAVAMDEKLTKLKVSEHLPGGLTPDQQKVVKSGLELTEVNRQLKDDPHSKLEKRALETQRMGMEHDLGVIPSDVAQGSGEWWRRKNAGESLNVNDALGKAGLTPNQISLAMPPQDLLTPKDKNTELPGDAGSKGIIDELAKLRGEFSDAWKGG